MDCNLTPEGIWRKRISVPLSAEERALVNDRSPAVAMERSALHRIIKARTCVPCDDAECLVAQAVYDAHAVAGHDLVSADIETSIPAGIINCRNEKGEHIQIRF